MINAIIFDWGGVLAPADTEIAAKRLSGIFGCDFLQLKEKMGKYEKECSESSDYSSFLSKIEAEFRIPKEEAIRALVEIPVWSGFELAKSFAGKFKLCILSDQMQFKIDHIKENNDLSFFDYVLFSSEIGVQKPSKEAFQMMLDRLGESPENCLFIDDREKNIEAAKKLGFQVIHCSDIKFLENQINIMLEHNSFKKS